MKIHFKNLGPLKSGEIDLSKRVNLFVGYNNSGKTYASLLLWSMFDYETQPQGFKGNSLNFSFDLDNHNRELEITHEMLNTAENEYLSQVKSKSIATTFNISPDNDLINNIKLSLRGEISDAVRHYGEKMLFIFISKERTTRAYSLIKTKNSFKIRLKKEKIDGFEDSFNFQNLQKAFPTYTSYSITYDNEPSYINKSINRSIERIIFNSIIGSRFLPFFLPANRTFFPAYYKYVYTAAKDELDLMNGTRQITADNVVSENKPVNPFTKPLNRLVKQMFDLGKQPKPNNYYKDLLDELRELIGGDIEHQANAGLSPVEFKLRHHEGQELEMHLSSSSSNQLATLYLYFKYWANDKNNFLFIDEPEENLHPSNQIKLINILMKFASMNNNRILITTHSPLMSEAINNYMHLAHLKESTSFAFEKIKEIQGELDSKFDLKKNDFGLYFFDGSHIKEYAITAYGTLFKEFKEVETRMKEISSVLKNHIFESEK
ncbi:ATP-binding protein [Hymenobacter sp. DH14]|uniref:ATP-binding protein n=1 Tax=Hymenobacter cyanobacteriorum TaxID=2926463 RepID=A0A9X2AGM6_9BACT|nr:AAA family ATPase [Hymenobacter cyanobacteriorum]MCI1189411.1 ATP-binding protein [Hymenobacter cyanobacteriorum]